MRTWIVLGVWCCSALAQAEETAPQRIDLDSVAALVATVASCAALHAAAADVLDRERLSDHAEVARRRAHVDQLTAMYLLAEDRVAKGGARQDLGEFSAHVEQLTAAAYARMAAVVASDDPAAFRGEEDVSESLVALEDEVLAKLAQD